MFVGCGGQARLEAERRAAEAARADAEAALAKARSTQSTQNRPKFESELIISHRTNGGEGSSSHKSTRYDADKPFTAVENSTTTIKGDEGTRTFNVRFKEHRDGKDRYEVTATIGDAKGGQSTTTSEHAYDGNRLVVFQSENATLTLQPPSK
jgi:hypothetical protein